LIDLDLLALLDLSLSVTELIQAASKFGPVTILGLSGRHCDAVADIILHDCW
jgi:hypothetical protein